MRWFDASFLLVVSGAAASRSVGPVSLLQVSGEHFCRRAGVASEARMNFLRGDLERMDLLKCAWCAVDFELG